MLKFCVIIDLISEVLLGIVKITLIHTCACIELVRKDQCLQKGIKKKQRHILERRVQFICNNSA
jgi:hypothetical protein